MSYPTPGSVAQVKAGHASRTVWSTGTPPSVTEGFTHLPSRDGEYECDTG